jgi:TonB family protein
MEEDAPDERDLAMEGYSTHVRRVIREFYIRRAQTCFDHESARDGEAVRGTVLIGFTIQQSGEVANTTIDRNTTGRETLGACLARQVDQWRLPPPPAEMGDVDMQMPFSR